MKRAFSILLVAWLCACGNRESIESIVELDDPLVVFNDFPDSLFLGLYFDQAIEMSKKNLEQNKFELIDSSGAWRYWSEEDSNEVILPATEHLHSLKVIMKSSEIFRSVDLLHKLLKQKAASAQCSAHFSVYTYEQRTLSFKLSVFEQKDLIRLNFEEQMRK